MKDSTYTSELKKAIELLEEEQKVAGQRVKDEFHTLLKSATRSVATSPYLIENLINTGVGAATGYISRKLVVGGSTGIIRNVLGSILQFGVTNVVAQHPSAFKTASQLISKLFTPRKEANSEEN